MKKQPYIMANLVYTSPVCGKVYLNQWLEFQLKSLMDSTNLPALREKYNLEYTIFTDDEAFHEITRHPNFMALGQICATNLVRMEWPADSDKFASRYAILVQTFHESLKRALEQNAWLSVWVADLVFAKHAMPRILSRLEQGHDAVFNVPIRSVADSVNGILHRMSGAPTDLELFEVAYRHTHPLWVHSQWDAHLFTRMPYSMLWDSGTGLVAHNFGITPIAFKPNAEMAGPNGVRGVIDADVPAFCRNPFWALDWTDAPVAGVEPLSNGHYPMWTRQRANVDHIVAWAKGQLPGMQGSGIMPQQVDYLDKPLFYPSRKQFANDAMAAEAHAVAVELQRRLRT